MIHNVDAIYDRGVLRPIHPLQLPEGAAVRLQVEEVVEAASQSPGTARIPTPRLANPEQVTEFEMEVREISDAGV
jgi:predicted DNA-binding antitoxin AbrB/MazE fold protein